MNLHVVARLVVGCALLASSCKQQEQVSRLKDDSSSGSGYMSIQQVIDAYANPEVRSTAGSYSSYGPDYTSTLIPEDQLFSPDAEDIVVPTGLSLQDGAGQDVDLRNFDTAIRDQGQRGTCTAFAATAGLENLLKQQGTTADLSEEHLWSAYGQPYSHMAISAVQSTYLVNESEYPYNGQPSSTSGRYKVQSIRSINFSSIASSLASERKPVYFAVATNTSWKSPARGMLNSAGDPNSGMHSGHAILITGIAFDSAVEGGGFWIIKNSWTSRWGDSGYGYMPFSYCQRWRCQAWVFSGVDSANGGGGGGGGVTPTPPQPVNPPGPVNPNPTPTAGACSCDKYQRGSSWFCGYRKGGAEVGTSRWGPFADQSLNGLTCDANMCAQLGRPSECSGATPTTPVNPAPPRPPTVNPSTPTPPAPTPPGGTVACTCRQDSSGSCFLVRAGKDIPVGPASPNCAQTCYNKAAANGCKY